MKISKVIKKYTKLAAAIGVCQLAGVIGSVFTVTSVDTWYQTLLKPELTPPGWVFGPVWITLYTLMGVALFLVWQQQASRQRRIALGWFVLQFVCNALWSVIFFGAQSPVGGLVVIGLLWLLIVGTIISFKRISKLSAWLLVPYLLWVSYATYLNCAIVILN